MAIKSNFFYPVSFQDHYRYSYPAPRHQLVEFLKSPESTGTPFDEAVKACRLYYEISSAPLNICLSGGLDSECMLQAALASGVPLNVTIFRYWPNYNEHDIQFAVKFCEERKLAYKFVELDVIHFYESGEFLEWALKYRVNSPQFAVHLKCLSLSEDNTVFAGTPPYINYFDDKGQVVPGAPIYTPSEKEYGYDRLLKSENRKGMGHFFQYTPELYFSFLIHTTAGDSLEGRGRLKLHDHYLFKKLIFEQGGFKDYMYPQRSVKQTGFEKVKEYYANRYGIPDVYEKLFRIPLQKLFPPEESVLTVIPQKTVEMFLMNKKVSG